MLHLTRMKKSGLVLSAQRLTLIRKLRRFGYVATRAKIGHMKNALRKILFSSVQTASLMFQKTKFDKI